MELALVRPVPAPGAKSARRAPDWVRGVGCAAGLVLSACMDGALVLHSLDSDGTGPAALAPRAIAAWVGHSGPAQAVAVETGPALPATHDAVAVTGGKDGAARLWRLRRRPADGGARAADSAECCGVLVGHETSVTCAAWGRGLGSVATGDWDGQVCLWDSGAASEPGWAAAGAGGDDATKGKAGGSKRQRIAEPAELVEDSSPAARVPAHRGAVGGVAWVSPSRLVTAGWDRTIKIFDPQHRTDGGAHAAMIDCGKPCTGLASAAAAGAGGEAIATSHSDGIVRVWDSRAVGGGRAVSLRGHTAWASSVAWRPGHSHHLASGSHDGRVALWDIRAPSGPLHWSIQHDEGQKCLGVSWDSPSVVCSGGSDRRVRSAAI